MADGFFHIEVNYANGHICEYSVLPGTNNHTLRVLISDSHHKVAAVLIVLRNKIK